MNAVHAAEALVLGAAVIPLARVRSDAGVRRRFEAFPGVQRAMSGAIFTYLGAIAALVILAPALLHAAVMVAAIAVAAERWQARVSFGRRRGLPPGSLGVLSLDPWTRPRYYRDLAERHGPVFKYRHFVYPAVGIASLEKAGELFRSHGDSLLIPPAPFSTVVPGGFVRYIDHRHGDIASALRSSITPAALDAAQPAFACEARAALMRLASDPASQPLPVADRMVRNAMMHCFYGIRDEAEIDHLDSLYSAADYRGMARAGRNRTREAVVSLIGEVRRIAIATGNGGNHACPTFLSELIRLHPAALDDDELLGNFAYMFHTGRLDSAGLMVWLIATLAEETGWTARLAAEIDAGSAAMSAGGLADRIVRETLRLHQSEFILRRTSRPVQWDGLTIPAGWYVRICVQEAHRDPAMFNDPDAFDPNRFLGTAARARVAPFGLPPRICPGANLSRSLGMHLVTELASAYEVRVARSAPLEFSGFHWRPGRDYRVELAPRS